jgi:hypothetical protein
MGGWYACPRLLRSPGCCLGQCVIHAHRSMPHGHGHGHGIHRPCIMRDKTGASPYSTALLAVARTGMEKLVRIFDLEKPAAEPLKLPPAHSGIRSVNFIQNDNTIICSYVDKPGIG